MRGLGPLTDCCKYKGACEGVVGRKTARLFAEAGDNFENDVRFFRSSE